MKCAICGIEIRTIDEAIRLSWIPSFYEGEEEHGPACCSCAETMMGMGDNGEMELKAEYSGKIQYMDGDYGGKPKREDLMIEIFIMEEGKGQSR